MISEDTQSRESKDYNNRFFWGALLNVALVAIEIIYGLQANSVALISDGFHNAADVLGLLIAWGSFHLSKVKTSGKFTYGLKNTTIIAAFINAVMLFMAVGGICWEAIQRMSYPEYVNSHVVMIVAIIATIINSLTAFIFMAGNKDINIRGVFINMASDAAVSFCIIIGSIVIFFTGWLLIDPILSILISILILISSWRLFRESVKLILHAVPEHIDVEKVKEFLLQLTNVTTIHDLHIWAISTTETAMSVHLVISDIKPQVDLQHISQELNNKFQINHTTIQIEYQDLAKSCDTSCEKK